MFREVLYRNTAQMKTLTAEHAVMPSVGIDETNFPDDAFRDCVLENAENDKNARMTREFNTCTKSKTLKVLKSLIFFVNFFEFYCCMCRMFMV